MRNLIILVLVLTFENIFSQYRFVYRIDFKIDSLNKDFVQSENFNLDITSNGSVFYPEVFSEWASIYQNNGSVSKSKLPETKLDYMIQKNYKDGETYFREMIGANLYEMREPRKITWKHSNETQQYNNYKVKKATTTFAGRQWEAWFSDEFLVNDGPYKFKGLPGLILKIKDTHSDYEIYLVEVKKIDQPLAFDFFNHIRIKTLSIDYDTYLKKNQSFKENPALMFIEMGIQLPPEEMKKFSETRKSINAKQNNKIELTY
ncbi:GLPGLI family protein [Riemerella anatipestifer]|uniref:GLPGLI family protein n=1 Tax=Riemerella anatipestifer TaxID=34085 RepID=A0AAP6HES5_RIEAN|nr:GLPGLI family protein [Riemerella anatipestifer]MBT0548967.1 GLPGLI family protein [Riemerella anatipestifer]MBT0555281.1 GLPGLI family protein [Riemerella anatipestifer]MBT0559730.1 GLPGLI family protein [Riemerella anatipestifer]MCD5967985.1 GLPGLI family protein [Riemerella anatipestifer]MCU7539817.1 GLPGLI family protein [Riemerella anatipestifer]